MPQDSQQMPEDGQKKTRSFFGEMAHQLTHSPRKTIFAIVAVTALAVASPPAAALLAGALFAGVAARSYHYSRNNTSAPINNIGHPTGSAIKTEGPSQQPNVQQNLSQNQVKASNQELAQPKALGSQSQPESQNLKPKAPNQPPALDSQPQALDPKLQPNVQVQAKKPENFIPPVPDYTPPPPPQNQPQAPAPKLQPKDQAYPEPKPAVRDIPVKNKQDQAEYQVPKQPKAPPIGSSLQTSQPKDETSNPSRSNIPVREGSSPSRNSLPDNRPKGKGQGQGLTIK